MKAFVHPRCSSSLLLYTQPYIAIVVVLRRRDGNRFGSLLPQFLIRTRFRTEKSRSEIFSSCYRVAVVVRGGSRQQYCAPLRRDDGFKSFHWRTVAEPESRKRIHHSKAKSSYNNYNKKRQKKKEEETVKMGSQCSKQVERRKTIHTEKKTLTELKTSGEDYPGSEYHPSDRKNWMNGLNPEKVHINQIVWPGTHDSATNKIGFPLITRPFAQCQSLSIYRQLALGTRVIDIRVQEDRRVCHGILVTYSIDVVIKDIKKFLSETQSEIIILEVRTEFGHDDPPEFDKYLEEQLGEFLIHQDDHVFGKTISELLPKRIICVWKPRKSPQPKAGSSLWSAGFLKDNWINTDLPSTKFDGNLKHLKPRKPPVASRKYFYRVENTVTPVADNPVLCVKPVTRRIHGYARLFIAQCFAKGCADRIQVFSTDFIDEDFVDACVGLTHARVEGKA